MKLAVFIATAMMAAGSLTAQELTASISGAVLDSSGAVIPDAAVAMLNAATRVLAWQGRTNGSGLYSAPALPVGRYDISVEAKGFKKSQISGIELRVDQRARVDVTLQPGELVETVTVTGEGLGQIEAATSSVGAVINPSQVRDLPMPGRNVLNLLTLVGGVSSGGAATGINASQLSINGSRTLNSEFAVDGVSVVSGSTGGVQRVPSTEAANSAFSPRATLPSSDGPPARLREPGHRFGDQ